MSSDRLVETSVGSLTVFPPPPDFLQQLRRGDALAVRNRANSALQVHIGAGRGVSSTSHEKADTAQLFIHSPGILTDPASALGDAINSLQKQQQRSRNCAAAEETTCEGHAKQLFASLVAEKLRLHQLLVAKGALQEKGVNLTVKRGQLSQQRRSTRLIDAPIVNQKTGPYCASQVRDAVRAKLGSAATTRNVQE